MEDYVTFPAFAVNQQGFAMALPGCENTQSQVLADFVNGAIGWDREIADEVTRLCEQVQTAQTDVVYWNGNGHLLDIGPSRTCVSYTEETLQHLAIHIPTSALGNLLAEWTRFVGETRRL